MLDPSVSALMLITRSQLATHTLDYTFTHTQPREADAFGLDMGGRMALIPATTRLRDLGATLAEAYPQPSERWLVSLSCARYGRQPKRIVVSTSSGGNLRVQETCDGASAFPQNVRL